MISPNFRFIPDCFTINLTLALSKIKDPVSLCNLLKIRALQLFSKIRFIHLLFRPD